MHLGEVQAREHPDAPRVGRGHRVADQIAARPLGQPGARMLERQPGRIERHDPAGVEQPGVGADVLGVVEYGVDVQAGVDLAEVGLQSTEGLVPPSRRRHATDLSCRAYVFTHSET